jgi:bifunctional non-homologous end joining protein LigD
LRLTHKNLMLANPAKGPFAARGWIFELKYDGYRVLIHKHSKRLRLESRNGRDMTAAFPELDEELRAIGHDFVADGELVICDERGCPQFERLGRRARMSKRESIHKGAATDPAAIFAFDLLELDGQDYRDYPLVIRKAMLRKTLQGTKRVIYVDHFENSPAELWALANKFELEGVMAKLGSSTYIAGRSNCWQKIKTTAGAERERRRRP